MQNKKDSSVADLSFLTSIKTAARILSICAAVLIFSGSHQIVNADFAEQTARKLIIASSYGSGYGGYISYGNDAINTCRQHLENPNSLITIDQEGGPVTRFHDSPSTPIAPRKLGSVPMEQYFEHSVSVASNLKQAHCIDVNFGTVFEPIWGPGIIRSIPTTMDDVFIYGRVFADAMQAGGVIPGLKHFPGSTQKTRFLVDRKYRQAEGEPLEVREEYSGQIKEYAKRFSPKPTDIVMIAHYVYPEYSSKPALLEPLYYNWLREEMQFDGLIVTDAVNELKLTDNELLQVVKLADMILFADGREAARVERLIANWIRTGKLSKTEIETKLTRINQTIKTARKR